MEIKAIKIRKIQIPFVIVFKHFLKSRSEVESVIVEVHTDSGIIGYGESIPREYVTGESVTSVLNGLVNVVRPTLMGQNFSNLNELEKWSRDFFALYPQLKNNELCIKAAIELALLDAWGKENQASLWKLLLPLYPKAVKEIQYSAVVSAENSFIVKQIAKNYLKNDMTVFKLKVGKNLKTDCQNIESIKKLAGGSAQIRVDANGGWDFDTAKKNLQEMAELGVVSCEQPMPVHAKNFYPELVRFLNGKMEICIDESFCTMDDAVWMAQNKGANILNIRISKNGGVFNSLAFIEYARKNGIQCQLGAQVGETSLLSSAGRLVSCLAGGLVFNEGSFGTHLLKHDITKQPLVFGSKGRASISDCLNAYGLGVSVDPILLDKVTTETF